MTFSDPPESQCERCERSRYENAMIRLNVRLVVCQGDFQSHS